MLTAQQQKTYTFLAELGGPALADAYTSIQTLAKSKAPVSYPFLIAHLGRDLLNGVVNLLIGQGDQLQMGKEIFHLMTLLEPLVNKSIDFDADQFDRPIIGTTPRLVSDLKKWMEKMEPQLEKFPKRVRKAYETQFQFTSQDKVLAPGEYIALHALFHSNTHIGPNAKSFSDDQLNDAIRRLDSVLEPFGESFVKVLGDIDELVRTANRTRD